MKTHGEHLTGKPANAAAKVDLKSLPMAEVEKN